MPPNNPMTEGEALVVLRQIADEMLECKVNHGKHYSPTLVAWANRIDEQIAALTAHTAASGGEVVCQLRMKEGNPGAAWFEVDERAYRDFAHPSSIYHYRTLYTAPPAAVPADALMELVSQMQERAEDLKSSGGAFGPDEVLEWADELAALIPKGADHA